MENEITKVSMNMEELAFHEKEFYLLKKKQFRKVKIARMKKRILSFIDFKWFGNNMLMRP